VSPVKYDLDFDIPEDGILQHRLPSEQIAWDGSATGLVYVHLFRVTCHVITGISLTPLLPRRKNKDRDVSTSVY
jgi:hypothetical protein